MVYLRTFHPDLVDEVSRVSIQVLLVPSIALDAGVRIVHEHGVVMIISAVDNSQRTAVAQDAADVERVAVLEGVEGIPGPKR